MSFGLDYHIPNQSSYKTRETEFEMFYQNILPNLSHILENQLTELNSKLGSACHKYNNINVPYNYQKIVKDLASNRDMRILRQDKGRGVVIMDSSKYIEKCLGLLDNEKFVKTTDDPTKRIECKTQPCVRKIKNKVSKAEYLQLYRTGSLPGKFDRTAKIDKLPNGGNITELPLRPIVSNVGTASYFYQSIRLNYCHHSVNQNILLKIQKNLFRISKDCTYQRIITNWYHLIYHLYSPTCH